MRHVRWTVLVLSVMAAGLLLLPPRISEAQRAGPFDLIIAQHSGLCMGVEGHRKGDRALIYQYYCKNSKNRQFSAVSLGGGNYVIVNRNSGRCLDIRGGGTSNGARVQQYFCRGNSNQRFRLEPAGQQDWYRVVGQASGRCLDVKGASRNNRAIIQLWQCHGRANQVWRMRGVPG